VKDDRKTGKSERILSAVGGIGDDLVREAESVTPAGLAAGGTGRKAGGRAAAGSGGNGTSGRGTLKKIFIIAAAAVLLGALAAGGFLIADRLRGKGPDVPQGLSLDGRAYYTGGVTELPEALQGLSITAEGTDSRVIPATGCFLVRTSAPTDVETLTSYLTLSPSATVSVSGRSDTEFVISPAGGSFAPGTVYRLSVGDPENPEISYAFQTASEMTVKSLLPADRAVGFPVDNGIEITFSETLASLSEVTGRVSFTPSVKGTWSLYPDGRTVAFVPSFDLKYDTVYSFTVGAGVASVSGKKLAEDVTVRFRTAAEFSSEETAYVRLTPDDVFTNLSFCCSPGDSPFVHYTVQALAADSLTGLKAELYAYPDFLSAYEAVRLHESRLGSDGNGYSVDGLARVFETDIPLTSVKVNQKRYYDTTSGSQSALVPVELPSNLGRGVYLLRMEISGISGKKTLSDVAYAFVQITGLRCATVCSDGKTLFLAADASGSPVSGASVTGISYTPTYGWDLDSGEAVQFPAVYTESGTALAETGGGTAVLALVTRGDDSVLICANAARTDGSLYSMKYLYTDREVYFGDDTVNVWGFIAPLYGGTLPDCIYLQTGNSVLKTRIDVSDDGTFTASFPIENMKRSSLYVKITDGEGLVIASKYIRITDEEKPVYTASVTFDKLFYRNGDYAEITVSAAFFDGTPAPGLTFDVYGYLNGARVYFEQSGDSSTGSDGTLRARARLAVQAGSTDPLYVTVSARLSGFETQTLTVSASAPFFPSDQAFSCLYGEDTVGFSLYRRDYSALREASDLQYPDFPDNTLGAPANGSVKYTLIKRVITSTPARGYNTYTKKAYTYYNYSHTDTTVQTGTAYFKDGKVELPKYEVSGFKGYYRYEYTFYDGGYVTVSGSVYATKSSDRIRSVESAEYSSSRPVVSGAADSYAVGDPVSLTASIPEGFSGCCFWVICGNGLEDFSSGQSYTGSFRESMIPGASAWLVCYDANKDGFNNRSVPLVYDWESRGRLGIEITASSATYRPGDTASVTVRATDPSGRPVSGAGIILSVVDEACFALGDQTADPAGGFFESCGPASKAQSSSYYYRAYLYYLSYYGYGRSTSALKSVVIDSRRNVFSSGQSLGDDWRYFSEKGGGGAPEAEPAADVPSNAEDGEAAGGEYYVRKYFADNPVFAVLTTGADGTATLTFTVPDNITTWRLSACGAFRGKGLSSTLAGGAVSGAVCTQPFFVSCGACGTYIAGDEVSVSARAFGSAASGGKVSYTAVLYGENGEKLATRTARSEASVHAWFNFGKLSEGSYRVTVYGELGGSTDAVETAFRVIASAATAETKREMTAAEIGGITPAAYPVNLSFYAGTGTYPLYSRVLNALSRADGSGRTDALAARYAALTASDGLFGTDSGDVLKLLSDRFAETGNGYAKLFSYGSEDVRLTSVMLSVCPELFDRVRKENIASLLYGDVLSGSPADETDLCAGLLGLAALGEPVLDRLYLVASAAANYPTEAKLYLAAAFAVIGDYVPASGIWNQIRAELASADAEYGTLFVRADTLQERVRLSSLALLAVSRISKDDAAGLATYLLENRTSDESPALALAAYLRFFVPSAAELADRELVYTVKGERRTATVGRGKVLTLSLTKSEFESFSVDPSSADIRVLACYRTSAEEAYGDLSASKRVTVSKSFSSDGPGRTKVTLTVRGTSTRVSEYFELSDWIPSGARFVSTDGWASNNDSDVRVTASIRNNGGQEMAGYVSVYNKGYAYASKNGSLGRSYESTCPEYSFRIKITYTVRGAVAGTFVAEPAVVSCPEAGIFSISERLTVTIPADFGNWKEKAAG
jgi:hypothetical protein